MYFYLDTHRVVEGLFDSIVSIEKEIEEEERRKQEETQKEIEEKVETDVKPEKPEEAEEAEDEYDPNAVHIEERSTIQTSIEEESVLAFIHVNF